MAQKKIKLEDITQEQKAFAQRIVRWVVGWQSEPANPRIGYSVLAAILKRDPKKRAALSDAGLDAGLHAGLRDGLYAGLDAGLYDGLYAQKSPDKIKMLYCGVFWSWWAARYLIAYFWGCKLETEKLALLVAFCRFCPLVGYVEDEKTKKARIVILQKPTLVWLTEVGMTTGKVSLPTFELHGDGVPSCEHTIVKTYHWHNTRIPERMGITPSNDWKPEWLLDEQNSEIRRILISVIGYEKIAKALNAETIDQWREYSLLRFPQDIDVEPLQLLTMRCPSTEKLHALRVPPDVKTARSAIAWCNWDIDPEEFGREA